MVVRGGFAVDPDDATLPAVPCLADGTACRTVLVIGNVGGAMWPAFRREETAGADPLDRWTRARLQPIADRLGATFVHPSDEPFQPFQRWAQRADDVWPSPIGLLVHRTFGLWHAYRGAFLFAGRRVRDARRSGSATSPCLTCRRPALPDDVPGRRVHAGWVRQHGVRTARPFRTGSDVSVRRVCGDDVPARSACDDRYEPDQMRFHMRGVRRIAERRARRPSRCQPTPPGWYADPTSPDRWRWWNGHAWTTFVADPARARRPSGKPRLPRWLSVPVVVCAPFVVLLVGVLAINQPISRGRRTRAAGDRAPRALVARPRRTRTDGLRVHACCGAAVWRCRCRSSCNTAVAVVVDDVASMVISAPLVEEASKGAGILCGTAPTRGRRRHRRRRVRRLDRAGVRGGRGHDLLLARLDRRRPAARVRDPCDPDPVRPPAVHVLDRARDRSGGATRHADLPERAVGLCAGRGHAHVVERVARDRRDPT